MKRLLKRLIPCALLFSCLGGAAFAQRIATVDMGKVMEKYWKTGEADTALKTQAADIEKTDKDMMDDYQKAKVDYQKMLTDANDQAVSAEERDRRTKAAADKLRDIKDSEDNITMFERQSRARLADQKSRMRKNIYEEIKIAVSTKAKAGNYSMVIDSSAQTYMADPAGPYYSPALLYNNNETDITDAVIAQLNAGAPVESSKSDSSKTDQKTPPTEKK